MLVWFGLISLFNGISTFVGYLMPVTFLIEEESWYSVTHSWVNKSVNIFPKSISLKVSIIARLEFELVFMVSQSSTLATTPIIMLTMIHLIHVLYYLVTS